MRKSFHERKAEELLQMRATYGRNTLRHWRRPSMRCTDQENARRRRQIARGILRVTGRATT